jgi:peptidylprolyl isomerase
MKMTRSLAALAIAAAVLPLAAQTPATKPAPKPAVAPIHHATPGCAKLPELSPKIPAVPVGSPCAKPLYTVTRTSDTRLDYASPLVSPELKATLGGGPSTYSLDYIDTKIGTGELAKSGKFYTVHYTGYLADGTKFDSSVDRGDPITFPYGGHRVIPGWDTGFEGMHIGGKRRLFIPYQLAYGEQGKGPIPAKATLVFDLEFIAQSDTAPAPKAPKPRTPPAAPVPPPSGAKPITATPTPAGTPPASTTPPATAPATPPATAAPATTPPASTTPPPTTKPQQ